MSKRIFRINKRIVIDEILFSSILRGYSQSFLGSHRKSLSVVIGHFSDIFVLEMQS